MLMTWILLIVIVVFAFVVLAVAQAKSRGTAGIGFPYQPAKSLFSPAERAFLLVLDEAVGSEHRVFGKVRVADVASVKPGLTRSTRQGALNRIAAKHFDYVVCRKSDMTVVCAVELNDKSHATQKAQARDELVTNVCRVIGLPLLIIPAKATYALAEIQAQFKAAMDPPTEQPLR
jgi:hypothetical protein